MQTDKYLNEIAELAVAEGIDSGATNDIPAFRFGLGSGGISFVGQNAGTYVEKSKSLYHKKECYENFSFKTFQNQLLRSIVPFVHGTKILNPEAGRAFDEYFSSAPVLEYLVARPIYGIITSANDPIDLGPFKFYRLSSHRTQLAVQDPLEQLIKESAEYCIALAVKASEPERAIERADLGFGRFEQILGAVIGQNSGRFEVGVLNYDGWKNQRAYVCRDGHLASSAVMNVGSIEKIPIDDPYFNSPEMGFKRLWCLLASPKSNELERRIVLASEWLGQAYRDKTPSGSFLKAVISMEILFTHQEKSLINSSILSQISESVALILGKDVDERVEIERQVKRLYSMRSAITHAGKNEVQDDDLHRVLAYCRRVIVSLLAKQSYRDIESVGGLYDYLKSKKFGFAVID